MRKLSLLDCTLRDGGYCNQWNFGKKNIKKIVNGLVEAGIQIVECGFLTNRVDASENITKFTELEQAKLVIPKNKTDKMFVCMINYGEYELNDIPICDIDGIDGLRIAFHKKDVIEAIKFCNGVKDKGYKVFVQPMVSLGYTDEEFIDLINRVNEINPYAFYIVDSFGVMKRKDLIRLFYMVEHNLHDDISIGYHSHNNMQLAYSNAQSLVDIHTKRDLIIDSCVFGMGRGAGNLNTELFVEYLNDNIGSNYAIKPLLNIIDEILDPIYQQNYWGYSLPNYLSAKNNAHPNYASYLDEKKTLTVEDMADIFSMMLDTKKLSFDKKYIEELYLNYMESEQVKEAHLVELKQKIEGKDILIIAPGKSSIEEKNRILDYAKKDNVITISVNFSYNEYDTDYIFVSNIRRFRELDSSKYSKCIITSNIHYLNAFLQTKYSDLLNNNEAVKDNAGMMLIKYLISLGVKKVYVAGLDGYSLDPLENFADKNMNFFTKRATIEAMNSGMAEVLTEYSKKIMIEYITTPRFILF